MATVLSEATVTTNEKVALTPPRELGVVFGEANSILDTIKSSGKEATEEQKRALLRLLDEFGSGFKEMYEEEKEKSLEDYDGPNDPEYLAHLKKFEKASAADFSNLLVRISMLEIRLSTGEQGAPLPDGQTTASPEQILTDLLAKVGITPAEGQNPIEAISAEVIKRLFAEAGITVREGQTAEKALQELAARATLVAQLQSALDEKGRIGDDQATRLHEQSLTIISLGQKLANQEKTIRAQTKKEVIKTVTAALLEAFKVAGFDIADDLHQAAIGPGESVVDIIEAVAKKLREVASFESQLTDATNKLKTAEDQVGNLNARIETLVAEVAAAEAAAEADRKRLESELFDSLLEETYEAFSRLTPLIFQNTNPEVAYDRVKFKAGTAELSKAQQAAEKKDYSSAIASLRLAKQFFEEAIYHQKEQKKTPAGVKAESPDYDKEKLQAVRQAARENKYEGENKENYQDLEDLLLVLASQPKNKATGTTVVGYINYLYEMLGDQQTNQPSRFGSLEEASQAYLEIKRQADEAIAAVGSKAQEIATRNQRLAELNEQIAQAQRDLEAAQTAAQATAATTAEQHADALAEKDKALGKIRGQLADNQQQLEALQNKLAGKNQEMADQAASLADKTSEAAGLTKQLTELKEQIAQARRDLEAAQTALGTANDQVQTLTTQKTTLQSEKDAAATAARIDKEKALATANEAAEVDKAQAIAGIKEQLATKEQLLAEKEEVIIGLTADLKFQRDITKRFKEGAINTAEAIKQFELVIESIGQEVAEIFNLDKTQMAVELRKLFIPYLKANDQIPMSRIRQMNLPEPTLILNRTWDQLKPNTVVILFGEIVNSIIRPANTQYTNKSFLAELTKNINKPELIALKKQIVSILIANT